MTRSNKLLAALGSFGLSASLVTLLPQAHAQLPGRTADQGDPAQSQRMIVPLNRQKRAPDRSTLPGRRFRSDPDDDAATAAETKAAPTRSPAFSNLGTSSGDTNTVAAAGESTSESQPATDKNESIIPRAKRAQAVPTAPVGANQPAGAKGKTIVQRPELVQDSLTAPAGAKAREMDGPAKTTVKTVPAPLPLPAVVKSPDAPKTIPAARPVGRSWYSQTEVIEQPRQRPPAQVETGVPSASSPVAVRPPSYPVALPPSALRPMAVEAPARRTLAVPASVTAPTATRVEPPTVAAGLPPTALPPSALPPSALPSGTSRTTTEGGAPVVPVAPIATNAPKAIHVIDLSAARQVVPTPIRVMPQTVYVPAPPALPPVSVRDSSTPAPAPPIIRIQPQLGTPPAPANDRPDAPVVPLPLQATTPLEPIRRTEYVVSRPAVVDAAAQNATIAPDPFAVPATVAPPNRAFMSAPAPKGARSRSDAALSDAAAVAPTLSRPAMPMGNLPLSRTGSYATGHSVPPTMPVMNDPSLIPPPVGPCPPRTALPMPAASTSPGTTTQPAAVTQPGPSSRQAKQPTSWPPTHEEAEGAPQQVRGVEVREPSSPIIGHAHATDLAEPRSMTSAAAPSPAPSKAAIAIPIAVPTRAARAEAIRPVEPPAAPKTAQAIATAGMPAPAAIGERPIVPAADWQVTPPRTIRRPNLPGSADPETGALLEAPVAPSSNSPVRLSPVECLRILAKSPIDADRQKAIEGLAKVPNWQTAPGAAIVLRQVALNDYSTKMRAQAIGLLAAVPSTPALTADTLELVARFDSEPALRAEALRLLQVLAAGRMNSRQR